MKQQIKATWQSGVHLISEGPGGTLPMDGSKDVGGQEKGLRPKALMLSALAGCAGVDLAMLLEKMRAEVENFEIEVTGELTEEHPKYYHKVSVCFKLYGTDFKKDKIKKAIDLSESTYCGVMAMFKKFATVTTSIAYYPPKNA